MRFRRLIRTNQFWCGFGFMTMLMANGCLARAPLVKQSFAFAVPSVVSNTPAASNRVLAIRSLTVEPPFDGPSLVYRTGEFSYERDPYANFLVSPAQSLVVPVREHFRGHAPFRTVSESGSALRANTLVEVSVHQLYGDFQKSEKPAAVLGIRLVFFEAPKGVPGSVLFAKTYLQRIPIPSRTPAALVKGWDEALNQILGQSASDFASNSGSTREDGELSASSGRSGVVPGPDSSSRR